MLYLFLTFLERLLARRRSEGNRKIIPLHKNPRPPTTIGKPGIFMRRPGW
jgi:hypothetical protein